MSTAYLLVQLSRSAFIILFRFFLSSNFHSRFKSISTPAVHSLSTHKLLVTSDQTPELRWKIFVSAPDAYAKLAFRSGRIRQDIPDH